MEPDESAVVENVGSESSQRLDDTSQFVQCSEPETGDAVTLPPTQVGLIQELSASQVQNIMGAVPEGWTAETQTIYTTSTDQNYLVLRFVQPKTSTPDLLVADNPKGTAVETNVVVDGQSASSQLTQLQHIHTFATNVMRATGQSFTVPSQLKTVKRWTNHSSGGSPRDKAPSGEKVYICEVEGCGRSFTSMGYLRYHQAVHEGQKALKCTFDGCDREFSWPAHLKYHQLTHTGDRQHKCSIEGCGKTFYTAQRLAVHQRTHTGEKPFRCMEVGCDKSFTTAGNLKNHIRVHTGERPYPCNHRDCGVRFAEYSSLKKHKLIHTGEKPFVCEICGRKFTQSGSRKIHMKGHHKTKSGKKKCARERGIQTDKQNVLVLRQADVFQYRDFHSSESVVFSPAAADHVVTVTTQPAEGETDQLDLHHGILGGEEVLTSEDGIQGGSMACIGGPPHSMGANVVVLSQPQEIVSMSTSFQPREQVTQEEVVYSSDLLHSDLDHEEIANNISQSGLTDQQTSMPQSSTSRSTDEVAMDPMMETDDESEAESHVWVEND